MFIRNLIVLSLVLTTLTFGADARAQSAPSMSLRPPSPTGRYFRIGFGISVLPSRLVAADDDAQGRLVATSGVILTSLGRRFRSLNAVHVDFLMDIGPSPRVTIDGETNAVAEVTFKRYALGVGMTRFIGNAEGPSVTYSLGAAGAVLDNAGEDTYATTTIFAGIGGYASIGAGREWRIRNAHLGLLGLCRAEFYQGIGNGERVRGASMSLLFTVSRSQLVD